MSLTRIPGSGCPRRTSRREDRHIVRNARLQTTASSAATQTQVTPSQGLLCLLEPYEGAWLKDIWDRGTHYVCCPSRPPIDASVLSGVVHEETELQWNRTRSSLATNSDSVTAVMRIAFVCGDPVVNASILPLLYRDTPAPTARVMVWVPLPIIHGHP
ncbi:uncharacterized protein TNCV_1467421 [Trichonephila clavipes]|uniref:Uncharacterized protein n=1 Tax=Trichonephila clavipes TaxID=2585209 RepID=A0A8X6RZM8_TRICX|nr:uncharacterized protein TNCV_1467421 [Trichonephila clavipes]